MQDHLPQPSDSRGARRWIASLLVIIGVAMLAWSAMLVIEADVAQETARRSLDLVSRPSLSLPARHADSSLPALPANDVPRGGSPLAELLIPRLGLSSIVLQGVDAQTLRHGPGHLENTPVPGAHGNVAIAGHRDTFFRQLRDVKVGDDVFLNTRRGPIRYRVTWAHVVAPHDLSVLNHTDDDVLTLITCYPFWVLGPAPNRFVVRALRVEGALEVTAPISSVSAIGVSKGAEPIESPPLTAVRVGEPDAIVTDDGALIRLAIERFRLAYNALLIRDREVRHGLLHLASCDVAIAGDDAEARCDSSFADATERTRDVRTFSLTRTDGAWSLRSTTTATEASINPASEQQIDE